LNNELSDREHFDSTKGQELFVIDFGWEHLVPGPITQIDHLNHPLLRNGSDAV